ncbi:MAG: hypothetical protein AB1486_15690 [Planctomycetota bacterium]
MAEVVTTLQDQNSLTPESFTLEVRANDPAVPGGAPDMSPAGLLGTTGPIVLDYSVICPGGGACAATWTITLTRPIAVPAPGTSGVPNGDFYMAIATPPAPAWPNDGPSCWVSGQFFGSPGEQMNPDAIGYSPAGLGQAGLGWEWDATLMVPPTLASGNRAWYIATRLVDDVAQPSAHNPGIFTGAPAGLNPNYGYAGLWPDMSRPDASSDGIDIRVRTTNPVGTPVFLIVGVNTFPVPLPLGLVDGYLVIAPPYWFTPPIPTVAPPPGHPPTTSEAIFGPGAGSPGFAGFTVYFQGVSNGTGGLRLTTMCTIRIVN